jgi:hypothetical protein
VKSSVVYVASACLLFVGGCGGGSENEQDQLQSALDDVGQALDERDPKAVCDGLGAMARRQVILVGHSSSPSCAFGIRTFFLKSLTKSRRAASEQDRPQVTAVEHRQNGITVGVVEVEGRSVRVPFVKEGEEWKVNSVFGLTPKASQIND